MALHLFLQFTQYSGLPASQKTCGIFDIAPVILVSDQTCTRATATVDLVKKTGPGPVFENTVLACSQPENLLQNLDRFPNGRSIGKRPEILVFPVNRSPVIHHTRETLPRYFQIGIGLVIPENDVVMRVKRLDQIALQQQRFHFAARHRRLQSRDTLDHHGNTWRRRRFLEIRTDSPDQIPRFSHVEQLAVLVEKPVNPRQMRQLPDGAQHILSYRRRCLGRGLRIRQ